MFTLDPVIWGPSSIFMIQSQNFYICICSMQFLETTSITKVWTLMLKSWEIRVEESSKKPFDDFESALLTDVWRSWLLIISSYPLSKEPTYILTFVFPQKFLPSINTQEVLQTERTQSTSLISTSGWGFGSIRPILTHTLTSKVFWAVLMFLMHRFWFSSVKGLTFYPNKTVKLDPVGVLSHLKPVTSPHICACSPKIETKDWREFWGQSHNDKEFW